VDNQGQDGEADVPVKTISIPELEAIEEAALRETSNRALTFQAPPDLVLRLVRSHRATSVRALAMDIVAGDMEEDLVTRIQKLRRALQIIEWPARPNGSATIFAKRALHADNEADWEMRSELGRGVDDPEEPRHDDEEVIEPAVGEVWQDALGAKYRVVAVDDENYSVKLEAIAPLANWVEAGELLTHARRVEPTAGDARGAGRDEG
jgi:hypothetical protein